jgi:hypothetical protein
MGDLYLQAKPVNMIRGITLLQTLVGLGLDSLVGLNIVVVESHTSTTHKSS